MGAKEASGAYGLSCSPRRQSPPRSRRCQNVIKKSPVILAEQQATLPSTPEAPSLSIPKCPKNSGANRRSNAVRKKTPDKKQKRTSSPSPFPAPEANQTLRPPSRKKAPSSPRVCPETTSNLPSNLGESGSAWELFLRHRRAEARLTGTMMSACMDHDLRP